MNEPDNYTEEDSAYFAMDKRIIELEDQLKWAYCKHKGSDSIIGLDCCDDYRDWVAGLGA